MRQIYRYAPITTVVCTLVCSLVVCEIWKLLSFGMVGIKFWCKKICTLRGATGAARAPKPGKTPIMAARRRLLFFKIEVRPRSCRSYQIWRPCTIWSCYFLIWTLLDFWAEICQNFRWFFGKFKKSKRHSEIIWPLLTYWMSTVDENSGLPCKKYKLESKSIEPLWLEWNRFNLKY